MKQAQDGDLVTVHYTGKLEDGSIFDSSVDENPLEFTVGSGSLISGFDKGVIGMGIGEKKSITIPPEQAYGNRRDDLVIEIKTSDLPENIAPHIGQELELPHPSGQVLRLIVTEITAESITLDANHPLAGKTLIFDLELVEISDK